MLTLCFTSVAAAILRQSRKNSKNARRTGAVVRSVQLGMVALVLGASAGMAQAGGHGGGGGGGGMKFGGNSLGSAISSRSSQTVASNGNSGFVGSKLNSQSLNNLKATDFKLAPRDKISTTNNNPISSAVNHSNSIGGIKLDKGTKLTDVVKSDSRLGIGLNNKLGDVLSKDKPNLLHSDVAKRLASGLKDKNNDCHDKCHDKCHDFCKWFKPCSSWYCWNYYPAWCPLYSCNCGYWYDVPVVVVEEGVDLQLLAVRALDGGDAAQQAGPAFRVWIRNNSRVAIAHPFNVLLLAARDAQPAQDLPQAGVRIESIGPGQVVPVDIRLPVTANQPGLPMLHVLVDSHREIAEVNETNNGAILARGEILPLETEEAAKGISAPVEPFSALDALGATTPAQASVNAVNVPLMMRGPVADQSEEN